MVQRGSCTAAVLLSSSSAAPPSVPSKEVSRPSDAATGRREAEEDDSASPALSVPTSPSPSPRPEPTSASTAASSIPSPSRPRPRPLRAPEERLAFREAKSLYEAGQHASRSNPLAAVLHFRQAAAVFGELEGQQARVEKCLWQAGMCWAKEGLRAKRTRQGELACEAFEQAKTLFHFIGDMEKEAMALYQLGLATHDILAAAESIKAAAILWAELGDEAREAMCYAELGHAFSASDPDAGIYYLKQALLLYLKLADVAKEAHALFSIGTPASLSRSRSVSSMASTSSSWPKVHPAQTAYNYISQARRLFARLGDAKGQAEAAYRLGKLSTRYGPKGELPVAVELFEEACDKFREAGSIVDEAWSMYRLALVMLKARSSALAIDYLAEARKLFQEAKSDEKQAEGSCLLRIGEIQATRGEAELAKQSIAEEPSALAAGLGLADVGSSTVSHSPGSSISGGVGTSPLAPVLEEAEEDEAGDDGSSSEAEEQLEVVMQTDPEAPGRRTSRGGDAAWWAVGTAEPASTEVRVPESREAAAIAA
ncbi:hypothetical protein JCM8202v2_004443 [Rhodotorula sphaerocarpa]